MRARRAGGALAAPDLDDPPPGIGHNSGREPASGWRLHCWRQARRALLPTLPIEEVRLRVARARELGLDYRTYASVRAASGRDLVAFLFSSNALGVLRPGDGIAPGRAARLAGLAAGRLALAQPPLRPEGLDGVLAGAGLGFAPSGEAPPAFAGWSELRRRIRAVLGPLPPDGVLLVGETALEREWSAAGRLAGFLPAARYFPA